MAFKIITVAELKSFTKATIPASLDALVNELTDAFTMFSAQEMRGVDDWDKKVRSEFFSPEHLNVNHLSLSSPPVASSPAPQVWESTDLPRSYSASELLTIDEDFIVLPETGWIQRIGTFPKGPRTVKVTYTGGYMTGDGQDAPAQLKMAARMQVLLWFDRRQGLGLQSQSFEGASFSYSAGMRLDPAVKDMLQRFRTYPGPIMSL